MDHPLLPVAAALAVGIFAAAQWPYFLLNNWECLLAATAMTAVAAAALLLRRERLCVVAALLGFFFTGATYLRHQREFRSSHSLETLVDAQADLDEPMHLTGWVSLPPEPREFAVCWQSEFYRRVY